MSGAIETDNCISVCNYLFSVHDLQPGAICAEENEVQNFRLYRYEIYTRVWCMVDEWLMDDLVDRGRMD